MEFIVNPSPALHQALCIDETLRVIAGYLYDDEDGQIDLLNMALSCRTWYEPAMDWLWSTLPGIKPLVLCLPKELLKGTEADHVTRIIRIPTSDQWQRFESHARRVRDIQLTSADLDPELGVHDSCFSIFGVYYPNPPLLPKLRTFRLLHPRFERWIHLFISPSLRHVVLPIHTEEAIAFLGLVARGVPKLEKLQLEVQSSMRHDLQLQSRLTEALCSLQYLTELNFHAIPYEERALNHLSLLPNLSSLSLVLTASNCKPFAVTQASSIRFPSLTKLEVTDNPNYGSNKLSSQAMIEWLEAMSPPYLRVLDLRIGVGEKVQAGSVKGLCAVIATYTTLEELTIRVSYAYGVRPVRDDRLNPLLELRHLRRFHLEDLPVDWSGPYFKKMASAWPELVELHLSEGCWRKHSNVQVSDLAPFAHKCPNLESLSLLVSPRTSSILPASGYIDHKLRNLSLGHVVIEPESIPSVAAFLDMFFPMVQLQVPRRPVDAQAQASIRQINSARRPKAPTLRTAVW